VAQSFGIWKPISEAARITEVPSGTVTVMPSTWSFTCFSAARSGVP